MFHSIRWRITIPYVVFTAMVMVGLGVYVSSEVRQAHIQDLEISLSAQARLISDWLGNTLPDQFDPNHDYDIEANKWSSELDARITLIDINGVVVGESHENRSQMDNHINRPEIKEALVDGNGIRIRRSPTVGIEMMYAAVPIEINGEYVGVARLSLPLDQINANIAKLHQSIAAATIIASILSIIVSVIIAGRTAGPIEDLTKTAAEMIHQDLAPPMPSSSFYEVSQLGEAFNTLVKQLKTQIQALQTEQGKLSSVLEQMTDGVIITDTNGNVELINPAAQKLFEVEQEKSVGESLIQIIRHHQIIKLWQKCREKGEEQVISLELPRHQIFIQSIIIPLETAISGKHLLLFQDLTRLRRLETVRRDFISNISHELRTPLASIKALTETLQEGALDDPPAAQRFLSRMQREVDALTHMVSELLELTRIESGQVPLKIESIQPFKLLKDAVDRLSVHAERAKLTITVNCSKELPNILADPPRLEQALVNLIHNSIKFTPDEGEIIVAAWQQADVVIFAVEDTGIGIPADDLPRIFERFYKTDRARSERGTGLGLAITKHVVEAHGGRIWAESVENQGSTFSFSIPIDN